MTVRKDILNRRDEIIRIANENGIKNIRLFRSVARNQENENSDIDFLVEFEKDRSLFDLVRFKQLLQERLGKDIDVVTENSIHEEIRQQVLSEAIDI
ncbi:nucleotidyltransferase [Anaerobacillus alkaliphilus]|uniref:Nucleotidyltransferase n=1 Tax=Anaerobacillus alkaliphilus TaxID=1548597 RepID=A0A4Q0VND0_9BACI|nr:nucleotidyltransferase family protein [Anaerobacillus alkaliphilus]RXI96574.1 nucleotidyltransferase [Anaerobacillus alkaliphilus]